MYDNIGAKIKVLARVLFLFLSALFLIWGIVNAESTSGISWLITLAGIVVSLVLSWLIYGFGTVIVLLGNIDFYLKIQGIQNNKGYDYAWRQPHDNDTDKK